MLYLLLESLEMIHTRVTGNVLGRLKWEGQTLCLGPISFARTPTRAVISVYLTVLPSRALATPIPGKKTVINASLVLHSNVFVKNAQ